MASVLNQVSRSELYGPERNMKFHNIRNRLTRSHVLQDGEYNYTTNKLKHGIWNTSNSTDFAGAMLDPSLIQGPKSQLVHHFNMGNMSGKFLDNDVFSKSTTRADFQGKATTKPDVKGESRIINWPDMAPQYLSDRLVGPSEYTSSYIKDLRDRSMPNYPKVDTSKLKLPLDPAKFWKQRNTNFSLGTDDDGLISEQQRAYGRSSRAFVPMGNESKDATDLNKTMKEMDKVSHVFRGGDYNGIVGDFVTTCTGDYGSRSLPPGEVALSKSLLSNVALEDEDDDETDGVYANNNMLQKYARQNTVPQVFKDASDGRAYQEGKHFHFGHDPEMLHSIYNKDFALSAQCLRAPPIVIAPPSAGQLLQCDPNQSKYGVSSNSIDFQNSRYEQYRNSAGKTALEMNLDRRDTDNVIFSYDPENHKADRQHSLKQVDFVNPPYDYRPPKLAERHAVSVDYLQTDDALPYPPPAKDCSEAAHNFMTMTGGNPGIKRCGHRKNARDRLNDGRSTHFIVGYNPFDFSSETQMKYRGEPKTDMEIPAAGKIEKQSQNKMLHLSHSSNVLDLRAADPHITNTRESLPARLSYSQPIPEQFNTASIMKKDYGPLHTRGLTDAQMRVVDKYETMARKDIAASHFFHTDTSGRNNFRTTAMEDFIQPENMTGRKYLAAR